MRHSRPRACIGLGCSLARRRRAGLLGRAWLRVLGGMNLLAAPAVAHAARFLLAFAYLLSGATKLFDFDAAIAEQRHFGLEPASLFAAVTIATQLGGGLALVFGRGLVRIAAAAVLAGF